MIGLLIIGMFALAHRIEPVDSGPNTIIVPDGYPTIQEAINDANGGDTIFVRNGTYSEHLYINKSIALVGENRSTTIIDGDETGTVVAVYADFVTVKGFTVQHSGFFEGLPSGIEVGSLNCTIVDNIVALNKGGVSLLFGGNHTISDNTISSCYYGMNIIYSENNRIFHNCFLTSTQQVYITGSFNTWDDGYPSGGNYWSDYNGTDLSNGEYQNETGSDTIGDVPYAIDTNNQDKYPLVFPLGTIPGDVNRDGYVGIDDIFVIASHFGNERGDSDYFRMYDLNGDGYIGIDDIFAAASHFGEEPAPTSLLDALSKLGRYSDNPILTRGLPNTWESHQVYDPIIIETPTEYVMYYSGMSDTLRLEQVGRATAPKSNPFQWTEDSRNPVLRAREAYDRYGARLGSVVKLTNGTLLMYYGGKSGLDASYRICLATSNDGVNWTKHPHNPLLYPSDDETSVEDPAVIFENGELYMIYALRTSSATLPLLRGATSDDCVTWTKQSGTVLEHGSSGEWDDCFIEWHSVCKYDNQYYLFYEGYGGGYGGPNDGTPHRWSIGVAISSMPLSGYVKCSSNPIFEASLRSGQFDQYHVATPAVYVFDNTVYLFYQGAYNTETPYYNANWDIGGAYWPTE
jgi:parallel beta-helix repeat protein